MLTHHGPLAHARNVAATQNLRPDARAQVAMPLFHVGGTSHTLVARSSGAPVFLMRLPDPLAAVHRGRATRAAAQPHRQDPEARAAQALLGGARQAGGVMPAG